MKTTKKELYSAPEAMVFILAPNSNILQGSPGDVPPGGGEGTGEEPVEP